MHQHPFDEDPNGESSSTWWQTALLWIGAIAFALWIIST